MHFKYDDIISIVLLVLSLMMSRWLYQYTGESICLFLLSIVFFLQPELDQVPLFVLLLAYFIMRYMQR